MVLPSGESGFAVFTGLTDSHGLFPASNLLEIRLVLAMSVRAKRCVLVEWLTCHGERDLVMIQKGVKLLKLKILESSNAVVRASIVV